MTRDAILAAIRAAAHQLGRAPTRSEFRRLSGISHFKVLAHFPSLRDAIRHAGFEPNPQGLRISTVALLRDWAAVARKLGKLPSRSQYLRHGRYSGGVFTLRFGSWTGVAESFARFARDNDLEEQWSDVLSLITASRRDALLPTALPRLTLETRSAPVAAANDVSRLEPRRGDATSLLPSSSAPREQCGQGTSLPPPLARQRCVTHLVLALIQNTLAPLEIQGVQLPDYQITQLQNSHGQLTQLPISYSPNYQITQLPICRDRPVLGSPLSLPGLAHEPMNETGVVFLFGMLAHDLGFQVECLQAAFPDCEAKRQLQPGKWQRVRIEFEFESRNFQTHRHPVSECDVIVCWRHNWPDCPENLQIVELSRVIPRM